MRRAYHPVKDRDKAKNGASPTPNRTTSHLSRLPARGALDPFGFGPEKRYEARTMSSQGQNSESFASLFEQAQGGRPLQRRYHTGESVEVTIVAIAREAVFADLGGKQEGMFERVSLVGEDGALRVAVGARVTAVVEHVDFATGQVRLRPVVIRSDEGDSGIAHVATKGGEEAALVEGARIKGKITGVERYGVFVQIAGTHGRSGRGLVPTVETGTPRGADLKKHFSVGQDVDAKILSVDAEGKIRLSIRALADDDERRDFEAFRSSQKDAPKDAAKEGEGDAQKQGAGAKANVKRDKPAPKNFGTLGDLLSKSNVTPKAAPSPAKPAVRSMAKVAPPAKKR